MWALRQSRSFPVLFSTVRKIYKNHGPRTSAKSELEIHQKFQRVSSTLIATLGTVGIVAYYYKKNKKEQLLKGTVEIEKDHTNNLRYAFSKLSRGSYVRSFVTSMNKCPDTHYSQKFNIGLDKTLVYISLEIPFLL